MNKVILIGGNHHNILGTARCFGINGFHPYGLSLVLMQEVVLCTSRNIGQKLGN